MAGLSRGALLALGTIALSDCSSGENDGTIAQPYGAPPTPRDAGVAAPPYGATAVPIATAPLTWQLTPTPAALKMSQRASFRLEMSVTNATTTKMDPRRGDLRFFVDDKPSQAADLAFSNGAMERSWTELEGGATAKDARDIGVALFDKPGKYVVMVKQNDVVLATATVEVTAD